MMSIDSYLKFKQAQGIADNSKANYAKILNKLNKFKKVEDITKDDIIEYINQVELKDSTKTAHIAVIKNFFTECGKPELVDWMKIKKTQETLKSDDILTPEDINKLLETCNNHYDKALIAFLYESGCRISEAQRLKWKDLQDTTEGIIISVPTKKTSAGFRKMILPFASQYLRNLQIYSYGKPDNFIFNLAYRTHSERIQKIKKEAGITKPFTAHKLRHAQATQLVKDGVQEAIIRKKLGWTPSSSMITRYQHLSDDSVIDATLEVYGIDSKKPKKPVNIKQPEKLSLTEATGRLFELEEANLAMDVEANELRQLAHSQDQEIQMLKEQMESTQKWMQKLIAVMPKDVLDKAEKVFEEMDNK